MADVARKGEPVGLVVVVLGLAAIIVLPGYLINLPAILELRRHKRKLFRRGRIRKVDEWER
jgi:regulator of sirC expression with transglutaminase-like and TPR domain